MRYCLKISLDSRIIEKKALSTQYLDNYLSERKTFDELKDVFLDTFTYQTDSKGILEKNWDIPYYNDESYFLFIAGHVLYRLSESEKINKIVPTPKEVFDILLAKQDKIFDYFKGSYYILLFNRVTKKITIYSSPFYLYPVFFSVQNKTFLFSNIIEFIIKESNSIEIDRQGLVELSLFDHTIGSKTIYKNVYTITGGKRIDISDNSIEEKTVYDISKWIHRNPKKKKESLQKINYILKRTIKNYISNTNKFNISLTGGFDGRLNFSMIDPSEYNRLQAFSYGKDDSLQLKIPEKISKMLNFKYLPIRLDKDFEKEYADLGFKTIILSGGLTPFIRANYLYAYNIVKDFSRNCIIGQCDMIRPLYKNPAGVIFNEFSKSIFFDKDFKKFYKFFQNFADNKYLNTDFYTEDLAKNIFDEIVELYIEKFKEYSEKERYFLFLYKESMIKFWQTECHIVTLNVDDFISFSDLDYVEALSSSQYFGLYKGIFAKNQFQRRNAHDLYVDLMTINNNKLNMISTDRFFKPVWLKYGILGYLIAYFGKRKSAKYYRKVGNDTFDEVKWPKLFYNQYLPQITENNSLFNLGSFNLENASNEERYRYSRLVSLKLWFDYLRINY